MDTLRHACSASLCHSFQGALFVVSFERSLLVAAYLQTLHAESDKFRVQNLQISI